MAIAWLTGTATQGGADAFVQSEIATALAGLTNVAFRVREIRFQLPGNISSVDNSNYQIALSRRSKAAMPAITDRDVLAFWDIACKFTTSGLAYFPRYVSYRYGEDDDLLIVEDPIYLVVDSAATAAANVVNCAIGYERATITQLDRLSLLTQSLE
jgi:hypothetical protein